MVRRPHSIGLCRVSTPGQAITGHSLERQEENVIHAAEQLGAPLLKIWSIDQSSRVGKNSKRKDLLEMLRFCKAHPSVKYLIVDEVDRFMRDLEYLFYFEVSLKEIGVEVRYASQPELNEGDLFSKLRKVMQAWQAEASNHERAQKSLNGQKARVKLGYYPFPPVQGYKKTITPALFEPDEPRFSLLQRAIRRVIDGVLPAEALRLLTEEGYKTPGGRTLYLTRFMSILRCPYYAGLIRVRTWGLPDVKGLHKPMITPSQFERLQCILDCKKFRKPREDHNPEYPLSVLMQCFECQGKLVGYLNRNGKGGAWPKYRCRGCGRSYHRKDVHFALDQLLEAIEITEIGGQRLIPAVENHWEKDQSNAVDQLIALDRRAGRLLEEKQRYLAALADNPDLKDDYRVLIQGITTKITEIEQKKDEMNHLESDLVQFLTFVLAYIEQHREAWWKIGYAARYKCKELLFPEGFFLTPAKTVCTTKLSPLFRFKHTKIEPSKGSNSRLVEDREKIFNTVVEELARWRTVLAAEYQEWRDASVSN